jgi:hypothetical protein
VLFDGFSSDEEKPVGNTSELSAAGYFYLSANVTVVRVNLFNRLQFYVPVHPDTIARKTSAHDLHRNLLDAFYLRKHPGQPCQVIPTDRH